MSNILRETVDSKIKLSVGVNLQNFMKKIKASVVKNLMEDNKLPHPITYYFDLFNVA
jgi:hypothetical protein